MEKDSTEQVAVDATANLNNAEAESMEPDFVEYLKVQAPADVRKALQQLEKDHSSLNEGVATALGAGTGAAGSLAALSSLGTVSGLSAAGVATGLWSAGSLVGGGMLVGLGVLATPVAVMGALGYTVAKKRKKNKDAVAVGLAIKKILEIQALLNKHKESFKEELTYIRTTLEVLASMKHA
ncbi:MAG: hypothetical protein OEV89_07365 [Desulfobulbaceae bacterium]|nr:hypothetical protein [Desulfobulbaceae bacterium]HIJ90571.1 hypothetical protein [Deltaproteobacteria bacterium]